jgi:hypothetical protein
MIVVIGLSLSLAGCVVVRTEKPAPSPKPRPKQITRKQARSIAMNFAHHRGYKNFRVKELKSSKNGWKVKITGRTHGKKGKLKFRIHEMSGDVYDVKEKLKRGKRKHDDDDDDDDD